MRRIRSNRGGGMIDVMLTLFLLGMAGVIFGTAYPACFKATRQAQEYKIASAIAQKKMEQLRAMNFESITYPLLLSAGVIDSNPQTSPYTLPSEDGVATQLPMGSGSLTVQNIASDLKKVTVTISWHGQGPVRNIVVTTLIADKRTRKIS